MSPTMVQVMMSISCSPLHISVLRPLYHPGVPLLSVSAALAILAHHYRHRGLEHPSQQASHHHLQHPPPRPAPQLLRCIAYPRPSHTRFGLTSDRNASKCVRESPGGVRDLAEAGASRIRAAHIQSCTEPDILLRILARCYRSSASGRKPGCSSGNRKCRNL